MKYYGTVAQTIESAQQEYNPGAKWTLKMTGKLVVFKRNIQDKKVPLKCYTTNCFTA